MPHPFMLLDLIHRNSAAVLFSASQTPEISMNIIKKEKIAKNTYKIVVQLENAKSIPSMSDHAIKENLYTKDFLKVSGGKVIAGGKVVNPYTLETTFKEHKPEVQFLHLPGNAMVQFQFIVEGSGELRIEYVSRKAGKVKQNIKL